MDSTHCRLQSRLTKKIVFFFFYLLFPQGFPITQARPYLVLQAILWAQRRLKREFSVDEIENGKVGPLLIPEDFDIEASVSTHLIEFDSLFF